MHKITNNSLPSRFSCGACLARFQPGKSCPVKTTVHKIIPIWISLSLFPLTLRILNQFIRCSFSSSSLENCVKTKLVFYLDAYLNLNHELKSYIMTYLNSNPCIVPQKNKLYARRAVWSTYEAIWSIITRWHQSWGAN